MKTVAIISGKGGVGKTTLSVAIAWALAKRYDVGLLDIDVTGSNSHRLVDIKETYDILQGRIKPAVASVYGRYIKFLSIALVGESYIKWKPGEASDFIEQMFRKTDRDVDYLVLDTPPGSHEEIIKALEYTDVAVLVTIPAELSHLDVSRTIDLLTDMGIPIAGQYVNFAYVVCPICGAKIFLFGNTEGIKDIRVIQKLPFCSREKLYSILDTEKLMYAITNPQKIVKSKKRKILKRAMLKFFLKRWSK